MRFKDKKFKGDILQNPNEFIEDFQDACRDLSIPASEQLHMAHHIFSGEAKRFYKQAIESEECFVIGDLVALLRKRYCSRANQNRVYQYLQQLTIDTVGDGDDMTLLTKVERRVAQLIPMAPVEHQHESSKISILRRAVLNRQWAVGPISRIDAAHERPSFHAFYLDLQAAAQLDRERSGPIPAVPGTGLSTTAAAADLPSPGDLPAIHFTQSRLGVHPGAVNRAPGHTPSIRRPYNPRSGGRFQTFGNFRFNDPAGRRNQSIGSPTNPGSQTPDNRRCYICGQTGHLARDHAKDILFAVLHDEEDPRTDATNPLLDDPTMEDSTAEREETAGTTDAINPTEAQSSVFHIQTDDELERRLQESELDSAGSSSLFGWE